MKKNRLFLLIIFLSAISFYLNGQQAFDKKEDLKRALEPTLMHYLIAGFFLIALFFIGKYLFSIEKRIDALEKSEL